ncbi:MAG: 50S ribosomal protein L6 [Candidatus Aenigmarchaeota archaeon]|nr:50S ribosomal protein L6 [Candidatus Aenigmarchaeota archaeon]
MKKEVAIPKGVDVTIQGMELRIKGPKGELSKNFENPLFNGIVKMEKNDNFVVSSESERRQIKAMVGAIAAHAKNMIAGVTKGYEYTMKIHYSHFPINVEVKDKDILVKNFLGEKAPRMTKIKGKVDVKATKDTVIVKGTDLEDVGQTCRNIEEICKIVERDGRVFNDGIYVVDKKLQTGEKL